MVRRSRRDRRAGRAADDARHHRRHRQLLPRALVGRHRAAAAPSSAPRSIPTRSNGPRAARSSPAPRRCAASTRPWSCAASPRCCSATIDYLISPTAPVPAFAAERSSPNDDPEHPFEHICFTVPWNFTEQPAVSINAASRSAACRSACRSSAAASTIIGVLQLAKAWETARGPITNWPKRAELGWIPPARRNALAPAELLRNWMKRRAVSAAVAMSSQRPSRRSRPARRPADDPANCTPFAPISSVACVMPRIASPVATRARHPCRSSTARRSRSICRGDAQDARSSLAMNGPDVPPPFGSMNATRVADNSAACTRVALLELRRCGNACGNRDAEGRTRAPGRGIRRRASPAATRCRDSRRRS